MTIDMAFNLAIGIIAFLDGLWVRTLQEDIKGVRGDLMNVRQDYQRREDAQRDMTLVTGMMQDIKNSVQRIENKLDRKADK
ncbi:hypothetical protein SSYM_2248 [Serratia symbiotica str. Tucson]|uniref:Uncharacterized protein n=2 Tax=Serratia symbiotica TaxID=138074 RepID=E9CP24_9GAMM|nr:hypothetical protein [Serratia symbiotica]EFW11615.1 hypothetical protein SSYM_2248 [Serratia symbiotica str. Tucson]BBI91166.1 uncharacterized protein SSYIS1_02210 [Serratia symbiotica]